MQTTRLILLALGLAAPAARASDFCQYLLTAVGQVAAKKSGGPVVLPRSIAHYRVRALVDAIAAYPAAPVDSRIPQAPGAYGHLIELVDITAPPLEIELEDFSNDDLRLLVTLPASAQQAVWPRLTPTAKGVLLSILEAEFRNGVYDDAETALDGTELAEGLTWALQQFIYKSGLSPHRFHRHAKAGGRAGCCRHANFVLGGMLLELGVPFTDLRFVSGQRTGDSTSHAWLEVRTEGARWLGVDATPREGEVSRTRLLTILKGRNTAPPEGGLRELFPVNIQEVAFAPVTDDLEMDPKDQAALEELVGQLAELMRGRGVDLESDGDR